MKKGMKKLIIFLAVLAIASIAGLVVVNNMQGDIIKTAGAESTDIISDVDGLMSIKSGTHVESSVKEVIGKLDIEGNYYVLAVFDKNDKMFFAVVKVNDKDTSDYDTLLSGTNLNEEYKSVGDGIFKTEEYPADKFEGISREMDSNVMSAFEQWFKDGNNKIKGYASKNINNLAPCYFEKIDYTFGDTFVAVDKACTICLVISIIGLLAIIGTKLYKVISTKKEGFSSEIVINSKNSDIPVASPKDDPNVLQTNGFDEDSFKHISLPIGTYLKSQLTEVNDFMVAGNKSAALRALMKLSKCNERDGASIIVRWDEYYK